VSSTYSVFGLTLRSSDAIPGLRSAPPNARIPDVQIHWGRSPANSGVGPTLSESLIYESAYTDSSGAPALRIWRDGVTGLLHLVYFDGMQFWMDHEGTEVWVLWPDHSSLEDAATYLLGPVLGLLLRFRGVTCLHASAVIIGDSAVAFVGSEGAGKSTTAAAFARSGCAVLSDDVVALVERRDGFRVAPAYPHICLWPDSVEILYGSSDALPRLSPSWEKRRLALGNNCEQFEEVARPLRAIYILDDHRGEPGTYVESMPVQAAFFSLVANSYATNILDSQMRANEFKTLSKLASQVEIRKLFTSKGDLSPDGLCQVVRRDLSERHLRK
jgi:hypothetical protein